jgi:acetyl-CoA carboxylase biotin carboxylase subunit
MIEAGVPVVPGTEEPLKSAEEAVAVAKKIGFPVMLKASMGGGGKGMRLIEREEDVVEMYNAAKSEAMSGFGDDTVYIEKFVEEPHHIEFQILGDKHGNVIHLFDRECSVQRRHQKIVEESPSPFIDYNLRMEMGAKAVAAARAVGYEGAGTIEFLVDKYHKFYFLEMNTRLQVEHGVTEMVTGLDIVQWQIRIAAGAKLTRTQDSIFTHGNVIECRINAENPDKGFRPSPGTITALYMPGGPGIRIDGAVYQGYTITPYYDSMISKLIAHGSDREDAINKMRWALSEFIVEGVDTNIDFQLEIIRNADFKAGKYDIGFLGRYMEEKKK